MENSHARVTRIRGCKRPAQTTAALKDIGNVEVPAQRTNHSKVAKRVKDRSLPKQEAAPPVEKKPQIKSCPDLPTDAPALEDVVYNIDKEDIVDPQSVTEYVDDIYQYMRQIEEEYTVGASGTVNQNITDAMVGMRAVLVDWLVDVHWQFGFVQETLYLTVNILDRYLDAKAPKVRKKTLQLIGVTAMFVASKIEEMYPPEISDFVYITDYTYVSSEIRAMEISILRTVNFNISPPLSINFLRRYSKAGNVELKVHILAKYALETSLLDYKLSTTTRPSLLAAGAIVYALMRLTKQSLEEVWTATLAHHMQQDKVTVSNLVTRLSRMIHMKSNLPVDGKLIAVRKKFSRKTFERVAELPLLKQLL